MKDVDKSRYCGSDRMLRNGLLFLALYSSLWAFRWAGGERYLIALVALFFGTCFIAGWALAFATDISE